eukprot:8882222-Ditylum_brightwellii.AAC.1
MSLLKERREEISFLSSCTKWGATTVTATAASRVRTHHLKVSRVPIKVQIKMKLKLQLQGKLCKLYISRNI